MRKLVLNAYGQLPKIVNCQIPKLQPQTYLVKMSYAPLNPSDLNFSIGSYGILKQLPTGLGFEGSGIIQQASDKTMIGKKVSISAPKEKNDGTYSTHMLVPSNSAIIWPDIYDLKQISCSNVNPLTVIGFKNLIKQYNYQNVLLSAANSQLSRMAIQYLTQHGINVYGTVRNQDQVQDLLKLGAKKIFVGQNELQELRSYNPLMFFDAVGGDYACKLFNCLPFKSKMIVYGRLSKLSYSDISPSQIYYKKKTIQGFWLTDYMNNLTKQQVTELKQQVINNHKVFEAKIRKQVEFDKFQEAFKEALKGGSDGKVLLKLS